MVMFAPVTFPVERALLEADCGSESTARTPVAVAPGLSTTGAPSWALVGVVDTRTVMVCDPPACRLKPDHATFWPTAEAVPADAETDTTFTPAGIGSDTETPFTW